MTLPSGCSNRISSWEDQVPILAEWPPNGKQLVKSVDVNLSELLTHKKKLRWGTELETNSLQESWLQQEHYVQNKLFHFGTTDQQNLVFLRLSSNISQSFYLQIFCFEKL